MLLLCEADELAYRCASACQSTGYIIHDSFTSRKLKDKKWNKTKIQDFLSKKGWVLDKDYTLEPYIRLDKEYLVNYTVDRRIESLRNLKTPHFEITDIQLWLSPSDRSNFRYNVSTLVGPKGVGYKAGRGDKPYWLKHIQDRLKEVHGAKELHGYEADDALGMFADSDTVLCHQDKDMNSIEGWHYDHVSDSCYYIEDGVGELILEEKTNSKEKVEYKVRGRGLIWFYLQMLTGDSTDNIPGCKNPDKAHHKNKPNISEMEGYRLLEGVRDEQEAVNIITEMYSYTYGDNWVEAIMEVSDLLWIVRRDGLTGRQYLKDKGFI